MESSINKQNIAIENQLIGLLYSCPFCEPLGSCIISSFRKIIRSDYHNSIKSFEKDKIPEMLAEHKKCLIKRAKDDESNQPIQKKHEEKKNIAYLKWTKNGSLDFLALELKKRNWIKSQKNFTKLFDNKDINLKVYWNFIYKYELAHILFKLKDGDYFRSMNNKGYFRIAERHIIDYSKRKFKKNSLKQISSKIKLEPDKYVDIIERVDNVIKSISF